MHYADCVSSGEEQDERRVRIYPPEEALRRARPLPPRDQLIVTNIPDEDWAAFYEALTEA